MDLSPTLEDKTKFIRALYRLNTTQMGHVVDTIAEHSPTAIQHKFETGEDQCPGSTSSRRAKRRAFLDTGDHLDLNVDAIDSATFRSVYNYAREHAN